MKAECISNNFTSLTKGKVYEVSEVDLIEKLVLVKDNDGDILWFDDKEFAMSPEINLPPNTPLEFQEILDNFSGSAKGFLVPDVRVEYVEREKDKITYKDFLKSSDACVMMFGDNSSIVNVYGLEFDCPTEERAEEVYAALITLFKENL